MVRLYHWEIRQPAYRFFRRILILEERSNRHRHSMPSNQLHRGRASQTDGIYAITTVTHQRERIFTNRVHANFLIDSLRCVERMKLTTTLAWAVMPDHMHWLFVLRSGTLGGCVQHVKSSSARLIRRHDTHVERVWQAGYYDHAIRDDEDLRNEALYILFNPVRSGLAPEPGKYPYAWSRWKP